MSFSNISEVWNEYLSQNKQYQLKMCADKKALKPHSTWDRFNIYSITSLSASYIIEFLLLLNSEPGRNKLIPVIDDPSIKVNPHFIKFNRMDYTFWSLQQWSRRIDVICFLFLNSSWIRKKAFVLYSVLYKINISAVESANNAQLSTEAIQIQITLHLKDMKANAYKVRYRENVLSLACRDAWRRRVDKII